MSIVHKFFAALLCILPNFHSYFLTFMRILHIDYFTGNPSHLSCKRHKKALQNLGTLFY